MTIVTTAFAHNYSDCNQRHRIPNPSGHSRNLNYHTHIHSSTHLTDRTHPILYNKCLEVHSQLSNSTQMRFFLLQPWKLCFEEKELPIEIEERSIETIP